MQKVTQQALSFLSTGKGTLDSLRFILHATQRTRTHKLISKSQNTRVTLSCQQNSWKLEQITAGSWGREIPIGLPGPLVRETAWMPGADTAVGAPDDWYRFLCVSLSLSLSLSELCAKNGQCLCARQNFNKGVRTWWWWAKRRRRRQEQ